MIFPAVGVYKIVKGGNLELLEKGKLYDVNDRFIEISKRAKNGKKIVAVYDKSDILAYEIKKHMIFRTELKLILKK